MHWQIFSFKETGLGVSERNGGGILFLVVSVGGAGSWPYEGGIDGAFSVFLGLGFSGQDATVLEGSCSNRALMATMTVERDIRMAPAAGESRMPCW